MAARRQPWLYVRQCDRSTYTPLVSTISRNAPRDRSTERIVEARYRCPQVIDDSLQVQVLLQQLVVFGATDAVPLDVHVEVASKCFPSIVHRRCRYSSSSRSRSSGKFAVRESPGDRGNADIEQSRSVVQRVPVIVT